MRYDVAILGLGAMGSAAAWALSQRGASVIGFDRLSPPHDAGSTHGHTRIIREAYYEHPLYVPLVRRAYELWSELERESNLSLMVVTGGVMVGPEDGSLVKGALESARTHEIAYELLSSREISERFPAYQPPADCVGLFETRAGMLFPEKCVSAMLTRAKQRGAALQLNEEVLGWRSSRDRVAVRTARGIYEAERLIVAAGAWLPGLRDSLGVDLPFEIERQLSHWFEPSEKHSGRYTTAQCPIGLWELNGEMFATLPDEGHGVKCGVHHAGATTSPDSVDRTVSSEENDAARRQLAMVMPGAAGRLLEARVCLYTNTPDRHFVMDWLKGGQVLIVSPCSGHGFKFASAIGEIAAQLALDGKSWIDLHPFSLARFR
jgi:sarcosine oxidase